jgi:hypothetical protein
LFDRNHHRGREETRFPGAPPDPLRDQALSTRDRERPLSVKKNMPRIGGFQSFGTARRTIKGFEAMLWLRKGFGFAGIWKVQEQNRLLAFCFGLLEINKA